MNMNKVWRSGEPFIWLTGGALALSLIMVAGLVVLVATGRRRRPEVALALLSMGALIAVPLLLWGNPRFHLPVSPFLGILAGGAVATGIQLLRRSPVRLHPE